MLVLPDNFGLVEPGIYRCSKIDSDNFPFLETLRLKSLIVLDAEKPPRTLNNFVEANRIELFNLGSLKISNHHHNAKRNSTTNDEEEEDTDGRSSKGSLDKVDQYDEKDTIDVINLHIKRPKTDQWMLIEKNVILKTFELLLNKSKHNILLVDSTSTLIGILRKIQKWNFNSILNEYKTYTGNSSKSNYYAENFLELIQVELIPHEIDQVKEQQKLQQAREIKYEGVPQWQTSYLDPSDYGIKSPEAFRNKRKESLEDAVHWDDSDEHSIDDEDMDDDVLSASPQIPANLLKLVEQRKHDKFRDQDSEPTVTPGTSPKLGRSSRHNSFSSDFLTTARANLDRRRSSIDSKFIRMNSSKFRNQNSPIQTGYRSSIESTSPVFKMVKDRPKDSRNLTPTEIEAVKQKYDFKYYKNLNKYPVDFENVSVIKLKLPPDNRLPEWFIRGRDYWESNLKSLNQGI
ncbi:uncharacterized protein CANTADRAFT_7919 [Suhomyces tanzawaensis NRRL Y-17324]|uniref:Protein OCA4 n=1 Tax=Suhomyces tanzawaensis NRRL Y-17324 TaxID=984487 RepID=A0A1E4SD75_9ASCO|nr:uncharacterized protein CANTADRAFT_7919 [Suhomyces tanzawaensis NRRL Y-17324]ODV77455.1 hypothetical protein CANTADRAFT_7919 [Suhomyces tanzawaensis NRRL Y-17324]